MRLMLTGATIEQNVSDILGIASAAKPHSVLDLIAALDSGLPLAALTRVSDRLAPGDKAFRFRLVPRATLARRAKGDGAARLSPEEGSKVARLAKVWALALLVWDDADEARDFLDRRHPSLDNQRPLEVVLKSEFGGPIVEDLLNRLRYGVAV